MQKSKLYYTLLLTWPAFPTNELCILVDSGAQGEYAGLRAIMAYLHANGEDQRTVSILSQFKQDAFYEFSVTLGFEVLIAVQYLNVFSLAIHSWCIVFLLRCALFQPLLMVQIQPALRWQAWRFSQSMSIKMGLLICAIYVLWLVIYTYTIFLIFIVICCIF